MLPFEGKRIDFGANKPKLRRFEIRPFCDKLTIDVFLYNFSKHFLENLPRYMYVCTYVCMYVCVCTYVCMYVCMYVCTYVCMYVSMYVCLAGFSKRLSTCSYKPSVPSTPPPLPNFPVPSFYKNGNFLSIRTSLDILDNILPRK